MNDSLFYVTWVVGLEVKITTCMIRLPVHFCGQFWTQLHNRNIQEWKGIISLNFYCEFDGRPNAVKMFKKSLKFCWSMWSNHESVADVYEPFRGLVVCCIQCYFLKIFSKYITDHRR
jgi:hypothetical protein